MEERELDARVVELHVGRELPHDAVGVAKHERHVVTFGRHARYAHGDLLDAFPAQQPLLVELSADGTTLVAQVDVVGIAGLARDDVHEWHEGLRLRGESRAERARHKASHGGVQRIGRCRPALQLAQPDGDAHLLARQVLPDQRLIFELGVVGGKRLAGARRVEGEGLIRALMRFPERHERHQVVLTDHLVHLPTPHARAQIEALLALGVSGAELVDDDVGLDRHEERPVAFDGKRAGGRDCWDFDVADVVGHR